MCAGDLIPQDSLSPPMRTPLASAGLWIFAAFLCGGCVYQGPARVEPATIKETPRVIEAGGTLPTGRNIVFSADGTRIAAVVTPAFDDRQLLKIWEVASGRLVATVPLLHQSQRAAGFDGRDAVVVTTRGGFGLRAIRVHVPSGRCEDLGLLGGNKFFVSEACLTPDGSTLLAVGGMLVRDYFGMPSMPGLRLIRWDLRRGNIRWWDLDHRGSFQSLAVTLFAFSTDGTRLAGGTRDAIGVWDTTDGRVLSHMKVRIHDWKSDAVFYWHRIALSSDGSRLARYYPLEHGWGIGPHHNRKFHIRVWNVETVPDPKVAKPATNAESVLRDIPRPAWESHALAFSPDGGFLAAPRYPRGVLVWNVGDGRLVASIKPTEAPKRATRSNVLFSPDGRTIATIGGRSIHLWSAPGAHAGEGMAAEGMLTPATSAAAGQSWTDAQHAHARPDRVHQRTAGALGTVSRNMHKEQAR